MRLCPISARVPQKKDMHTPNRRAKRRIHCSEWIPIMRHRCINLLLCLPMFFTADICHAGGLTAGLGYGFIPGAAYLSLGYRENGWGIEGSVINKGREEPTTHPGPEINLDAVAFAGSWPIFLKGGLVTGSHKHGYNVGMGIDWALNKQWAIQLEDTHFRVTEDYGPGAESENMISVGLQRAF